MQTELITDRTSSDVGVTQKGFYNYTDFNRLNSACTELAGLIREISIQPVWASTHRTWVMKDYPTLTNTSAWLSDIKAFINGFYKLYDRTLPVDLSHFDYLQANEIEKALEDINIIIEDIKEHFIIYSDDVYSEEVYI